MSLFTCALRDACGLREFPGEIELWSGNEIGLGERVRYVPERTCLDAGDGDVLFCSRCGCSMDLFDASGQSTLWVGSKAVAPSYCPNCGARLVEP